MSAPFKVKKSLQEELDEKLFEICDLVPSEIVEVLGQAVVRQNASHIADFAVKKGDIMPDFELTDMNGKIVSSVALRKKGPLVVTFFRGGWCPYCNITLQHIQTAIPGVAAKGATLVAISPQTGEAAARNKSSDLSGFNFPVLCDVGSKVSKSFRLAYELEDVVKPAFQAIGIDVPAHNGQEDGGEYTLPIPATYVIDRHGTVLYSFIDVDYKKRPDPAEVLAEIPERRKSGGLFKRIFRSRMARVRFSANNARS